MFKKNLIVLLIVFILSASMVMAGTVTRSFSPATATAGGTVDVNLAVDLGTATYYSIDEIYPSGWTVSVTGEGDASESGHLKWVVIQGAAAISYTYTLSVPPAATDSAVFSGVYMFEGDAVESPIGGSTDLSISADECIDSDGGKNYFVFGTVSKVGYTTTSDWCENEQLVEVYCSDITGNPTVEYVDCPEGTMCQNGVCVEGADECIDSDGDGYGTGCPAGLDCDDTDNQINPSATEVCDYKDNDCDGDIDEGVTITSYQDSDNDGYGTMLETVDDRCSVVEGYSVIAGDCDDDNIDINPGATEVCDDLIDNDCDTFIDCDDFDCASNPVCLSSEDPLTTLLDSITVILTGTNTQLQKISAIALALRTYFSS